ncbi:MAG: hypothetical protein K0S06_2652 [Microvirga sp.]|jgi:uncharacterized membrane protein YjgN (DUF898 family)|nr:hypothetical protein [Microvirga sp.]
MPMNIAVPVPPVASTPRIPLPERTELAFTGAPGDFFGLVAKGAALILPTAGFYRFWLITDIRRHLWGKTRIGGESLEYTGTGRELLIGFMIALAVLAPIYVGYFALSLAAERMQAFASVPLFLVLYVFGQYAVYRARRYRATRTIFRGVRFWMTGSAWRYAGKTFLWDLATLFSLGLALPWRMAALERYKMQNTRFGDLAGDFAGTGSTLFRRGVALWAMTIGLAIAAGVLAIFVGNAARVIVLIGLLSAMSFTLPIAYVLFRGTLIRWLIEGVRFGAVALESRLRRDTVFGCYLKWLAATTGYGAVLAGVLGSLFAARLGDLNKLEASLAADWSSYAFEAAAVLLLYLAFLLGLGVLKRYFLDRGIWVAVAASTTVVNLTAADHAVAAGEAAGSLGEGLADALDVGAI